MNCAPSFSQGSRPIRAIPHTNAVNTAMTYRSHIGARTPRSHHCSRAGSITQFPTAKISFQPVMDSGDCQVVCVGENANPSSWFGMAQEEQKIPIATGNPLSLPIQSFRAEDE